MPRISELPTGDGFTDDDIFPVTDAPGTPGATTKRLNVAQLRTHIQDTTDLSEIGDVNTSGITDGQMLVWDTGTSTWIPANPGGGAGTLDDLSDVATAGQATGELLAYNGATWVPVPFSDYDLDNLGDVDTSGVANGDVLTFNDATDTWEAAVPTELMANCKRVLLNRTNYQSISNDTLTTITWTNEIEDDEGWHAANSSDVVVPAGVYLITLQWGWYDDSGTGANGTGTRFHHIEVNNGVDTRIIAAIAAEPTVSFDDCTGNMVVTYVADSTCTFRVKVYQDSGGARAFGGSPRPLIAANLSSNTEFSVVQLNGIVGEGGGATLLDDLTDVTTTGVATGDFLQYNGSAWVDRTFVFDDISDVNLTGAADGDFLRRTSGVWVDHDLVLDDVTDVDLTGAADGDFLQRVGGVWVDHDLVLDDATDVNLSGATEGDVLTYESGVWVPAEATGGGGGGGSLVEAYRVQSTSGTFNPNTSWVNGPTADIVFSDVEIGDWIEAGLSAVKHSSNTGYLRHDIGIVIGGTVTRTIGTNGGAEDEGASLWYGESGTHNPPITGSLVYELTSGDFSGGVVTLRMRAKGENASCGLVNNSDFPTTMWAWAHRPEASSNIAYVYDTRTSNVTINSTSYMDTTLEVTIPAVEGSILQIGGDWLWYTEAVNARMDAVTRVGGSNINFCSGLTSSDNGIVAWFAGASGLVSGGPAILYTVQSGDVSGGNVTIRLVAKLDSASSRTFIGSADTPARFYVLRLK